ncbi:MAG: hypothetical protein P4L16_05635 [Chlamydiales bacterium]|nr:hypothetical protein [Chlamydiales bacterium]
MAIEIDYSRRSQQEIPLNQTQSSHNDPSPLNKTISLVANHTLSNATTISTTAKPQLRNRVKFAAYLTAFVTLLPLTLWATIAYAVYKITIKAKSLPNVEKAKAFWVDIWKQTQAPNKNQKLSNLGLTHSEQVLIQIISTYTNTPELFCEFLKGAYLHFADDGQCYETLARETNKHKRFSSHKSLSQQYAIRGHFVKEALFGTIKCGNRVHSWIQLERVPLSIRPAHFAGHFIHYMEHLQSGLNIGPYGTSVHTDNQPLLLK